MSFRDDYIAESAKQLSRSFNPAATAHVAVDLQKGYFIPPLRTQMLKDSECYFYSRAAETMNKIVDLSCSLEKDGLHTVWVRHNIPFSYGFFKQSTAGFLSRYHVSMLKDFAAHAAEMAFAIPHGKTFDKTDCSAFFKTDFAALMERDHISTLLMTGGFRESCVAETAKDAVKNGFETYIIDDLALSQTPGQYEESYESYAEEKIRIVTSEHVKALLQHNTLQ